MTDRSSAHGESVETKEPRGLLQVRGLTVQYWGADVPAVRNVSFSIGEGERVGLVGESGSGKTTLTLALCRLLPQTAKVTSGEVLFRGVDVGSLLNEPLRRLRGGDIGRVPQDSLAGLNPVITVGHQLRDALRAHRRVSRNLERQQITDLLRSMNMPDVAMKLRSYPHELSGGMRQRVLITMALINRPSLLLADEPTTALDATVQAQLLDVFRELTVSQGLALLLVSHDINVVSAVCARTVVMYEGEIVEDGATEELLGGPLHPYTGALVQARDSRTVDSRFGARRWSSGDVPLAGCLYGPRCPFRFEACSEHPGLEEVGGRRVRCFRWSVD